ncbi:MAG: hypothetical protein MJ193_05085, partial [Clostridia bacterium]|nr:hypothetical protein [Clostridia bacterium]
NGEGSGDYVYLFLGASPTKTLASNELIILVDGTASTGTIVGMLSAVHVAYRLSSNAAWTEIDIFGETQHYNTLLNNVTANLDDKEKATYQATYGSAAPATKAYAAKIPGLKTAQGEIDQIELIIYLAGSDSDCRNEAKGAGGTINIFFHTTDPA